MILEVGKALQSRNPVTFKAMITLDQNLLSERRITIVNYGEANGSYTVDDKCLIVNAKCSLKTKNVCDVCNKEFESVFKFDINEQIPLQVTEESSYEVVNGVVDFDRIFLDEFLLNLPSRLLCNENCELGDE
ncbi:MAG: hypothetical protein WCR30_02345 [Clostridia bacterium]